LKVAILGSGIVGRTLAAKIASLGHEVAVGTRDVDATVTSSQTGPMTTQTFAEWLAEHPDVKVATFAGAAAQGEIVFNATAGAATLEALAAAGEANLSGKILIDVANPLDFSAGFPPSLTVSNTDSLAERIQAALPKARVVKSLNTVSAPVMTNPGMVGGGEHDIFVSGNDQAAKDEVSGILRGWFGWRSIVDLGDLTTARGVEMYLPLWVRLMGRLGSPVFNVRIVT
jgi:hypothetical protein